MFRKKPKQEPPKPWWEDEWNKVKDLYPVGKVFDYLGIKMMVTSHTCQYFDYGTYFHSIPKFLSEYADKNGELHEWTFTVNKIPILLKQI